MTGENEKVLFGGGNVRVDMSGMLVLFAVCILANTFFVKAVEQPKPLKTKQISTYMAKSNNVGLECPDPKWTCPGTQPCCYSSGGWRCCPYTGLAGIVKPFRSLSLCPSHRYLISS
ncbi:hypothetical protein CHS0354_015673 [Potamilus streckersoni]|uniref:Uncharacterized protein n=1 Tax=Potamilus streckersoni TaxID=2493646 RepID=A0AAE0W0P6_9BIVA|nr:hypothetical protein CHS0354_015673 [Potamilus streckersoni]